MLVFAIARDPEGQIGAFQAPPAWQMRLLSPSRDRNG